MGIECIEQSLEDILRAKDYRVAFHNELLKKFNSPIISYKLNIPGPIKYSPLLRSIFDEGLIAITSILDTYKIKVHYKRVLYKNSGPECFISFKGSPIEVKDLCIILEDIHPLGRLYDFDILDNDGLQISRDHKNVKARKCLICNRDAFECGRSRSHDLKDLIGKIESMGRDYFTNK